MTAASHRLSTLLAIVLVAMARLGTADARAELPPLLPRATLFAPPILGAPRLSPDGTRLVWVGVTNGTPALWVRSVAANEARLVSPFARGAIRQPVWQSDNQAVLYLQEVDTQGTWHVLQAHVDAGIVRDLTPFPGIQARLIATSPRLREEILVSLNLRDRRMPDVFRVDVRTGALTLSAENPGDITAWYADADLEIRLAQVQQPGGEAALSTRPDARSVWRPIIRFGAEDPPGLVAGFSAGGSNAWIIAHAGAPAPRLLEISLATGQARTLSQDARYDVIGAALHPLSRTLDGAQIQRARVVWQLADTNLVADFAALRRYRDADLDLVSRDASDRVWTVGFTRDVAPVHYALYRRDRREVVPLFDETPALKDQPLASMRPFEFKARDGLSIEGYLTLPPGVEPKNLPAVILVHDGPWTRATWGLNPEAQWLANRGYVVVQPNYRGSTGYGKAHLVGGDREWGGKELDDLADARECAVRQGHADPQRVAILGSGFGGYAATAALARHPALFAAGLSESGPIDLLQLIQSAASANPALRATLERRVGHPTNDLERLRAFSPAAQPDRIEKPLLLAVSARDPNVPVVQMDAFVAALRAAGRSVEYLHFAEEGAALRTFGARLRYAAAAEAFLARHLGGRAEPPAPTEAFEALRR